MKRLFLVLLMCSTARGVYNPASDYYCQAWWKMDIGGFLTDSSGMGNALTNESATPQSTVTFKQGDGSGEFGATSDNLFRLDLDLSNYVPIKHGALLLSGAVEITVIAKFYMTSTSGVIFSKYNTERSFYVDSDSGNIRFFIGYNGGASAEFVTHASTMVTSRWYQVAVTLNDLDKSYRIRIWDYNADAVLGTDLTGSFANNIFIGTEPFRIGRQGAETDSFPGFIDDVQIYSRILSTNDIDAISAQDYELEEITISAQTTGEINSEVGSPFALSVTASLAAHTLNYQWYLDGVAVSGATSSTYNVASPVTTQTGYYHCFIGTDEDSRIKIESDPVIVYVVDSSWDFAADPNVAAVWTMDAVPTLDETANDNDLTNGAASLDNVVFIEGTGSALFNHENDRQFISEGDTSGNMPLKFGTSNGIMSTVAWFRLDTTPTEANTIIAKDNTLSQHSYSLYASSTGVFFRIGYSSGANTETLGMTFALSTDIWYNVGLVYNDSNKSIVMRVWDETAQDYAGSDVFDNYENNISYKSANTNIGKTDNTGSFKESLVGNIDLIAVYNRELTLGEIDQIRGRDFVFGQETNVLMHSIGVGIGPGIGVGL